MENYTIKKCIRFDEKTDETLKELVEKDTKIKRKKISESEYIRSLIANAKLQDFQIDKELFIEMKKKMAGCGNNLNQIARALNEKRLSGDLYTQQDKKNLMKCMEEVEEIRDSISQIVTKMF